jgi:hypothetical protein
MNGPQDTGLTGPLIVIFSTNDLIMYERSESTIFGVKSFYYWAPTDATIYLHGPYASVLAATNHFEALKREKEAFPNVIHINFKQKCRMAGSPPNFNPRWTICQCGQHYDEGLRTECPYCGRPPVRVL